MTEELPTAGYAADVPRPPIGVSIDVPDHWTVLDLNPETWDAWLDAFLDQRLEGRARAKQERGPARKAMLDILRQLHAEKVFMAAILAAEVVGELVSASITLAWRKLDLDGEKMDLEGLRQIYLRAPESPGEDLAERKVEHVTLPAGSAVKVTSRELVHVPAVKKQQRMALTQYVVPVLDTDWLALITTSTANSALASGVEEVAAGAAASLDFRDDARAAAGPSTIG